MIPTYCAASGFYPHFFNCFVWTSHEHWHVTQDIELVLKEKRMECARVDYIYKVTLEQNKGEVQRKDV